MFKGELIWTTLYSVAYNNPSYSIASYVCGASKKSGTIAPEPYIELQTLHSGSRTSPEQQGGMKVPHRWMGAETGCFSSLCRSCNVVMF